MVASQSIGCAYDELMEDEPVEDSVNESFLLDGKADSFDQTQGEDVLCMANTLGYDELDGSTGVSLDRRAARGIVEGRPFADLPALDAVPYVGPRAFAKMLTYLDEFDCRQSPSVPEWPADPFDPTFCVGDATAAEVAASVPPGEWNPYNASYVGEYRVGLRSRECSELRGCGEWAEREVTHLYYGGDEYLDALSAPRGVGLKAIPLPRRSPRPHSFGRRFCCRLNPPSTPRLPAWFRPHSRGPC